MDEVKIQDVVRFEQMFSFKYSPRPLTKAADMEQVDSEIASRRLTHLQERHTEILDEISQVQMGKVFDVYFEELRSGGAVAGRSDNGFMIQVQGCEELLGQTVAVKITNPKRMVLYGEIVN